jgi:hypothetical protein
MTPGEEPINIDPILDDVGARRSKKGIAALHILLRG